MDFENENSINSAFRVLGHIRITRNLPIRQADRKIVTIDFYNSRRTDFPAMLQHKGYAKASKNSISQNTSFRLSIH